MTGKELSPDETGEPAFKDGEVVARKYEGYFTADIGASYQLSDRVALYGASSTSSTSKRPPAVLGEPRNHVLVRDQAKSMS